MRLNPWPCCNARAASATATGRSKAACTARQCPKNTGTRTAVAFTASSGNSQNTELVTMAVSQNDAERLILMTQDSLPYLALVNSDSSLSVTTPGVGAPGH